MSGEPRREYRALPRDLADRPPYVGLSPEGKLLWLMLSLTPGPAGVGELSPRRFAVIFEERTGLRPAALKRATQELQRAGRR
jgi:hypothetical protein